MSQVTGIVQEINNRGRGKGSNIVINGTKYGCFDPVEARIDSLVAGEEVTFGTTVNGTYTNIDKTGVTKTGNMGAVIAPPQAAPSVPKNNSGGHGDFQFPIPPLNYQRSVVRRDSVAHAASIVNTYTEGCAADMELDARVNLVLSVAKQLEEYSCGDDIEKEAAAAVAALGQVNPQA